MSIKIKDLFPALCFAVFVFWLLSTVMDGPLTAAAGISNATSYFLPIHVLSLILISLFCPMRRFDRLATAGCLLSALLTLALAFAGPEAGRYILLFLGASGAFVTLGASVTLRRSAAPLPSAAAGLVAANLLFIPLSMHPSVEWWLFAVVAVSLTIIPVLSRRLPEPLPAPATAGLWHYLPFIVVFQIVSGLMYAFLMPAYSSAALLPGSELLFYIAAVFTTLWLARSNRDFALVCGVMLGMTAFALLHDQPSPWRLNLSMFAMQAGAGFIDLAVIAVMLLFANPLRGFGFGSAALCTGIVAGKVIGYYFADFSGDIALAGHLVLNLSIVTLYLMGRYHFSTQIPPASQLSSASVGEIELLVQQDNRQPHPARMEINGLAAGSFTEEDPLADLLPAHLRLLLSERELYVLKRAVAGRTYRETARELEISESSVKTYMVRIYEKMGVKKKKELFEMLKKA